TACPSSYTGYLAQYNGGTAFSWTQFFITYTANTTQPFLIFAMETDNHRYFFLDDASVVDVSVPATQLLSNPGFENSSTTATGWDQVGASCCSQNATQIINSSCNSGSNCLRYQCGPELTYSFIGQHFTATPGHTYNISFYLKATGTGGQPTFCDVNVY
ncbi:unnamed protein product, partial [Rotaria magnacalcarata]